MWLPKDERETLRKYHSYINNTSEVEHFINLSERAYDVTINLIERGLIREIKQGSEENIEYLSTWVAGDEINLEGFLSCSKEDTGKETILKFNLKGLDLANRYDNWFMRTGLWFAEYKDHWFWLIFGFLGGIIGALLVNWLSKMSR
jgi:hypothetical protein